MEKKQENYHLLNSYTADNIEKPKIILRKHNGKDSDDISADDLFVITLDTQDPNEDLQKKLPAGFQWALQSLRVIKDSYKKILADETERVHLEGLIQKNSYLMLEDVPQEGATNTNSDSYNGGCATLNGRPCIVMVNDKVKNSTLLHEAVHHSDLMLGSHHFSDLPVYQTIIMMIDAQISSSGANNKTVRSLRRINQLYKPGQLYIEGLAWISEMSYADLYQEKNHLGQSLKQMHATYTKAILEDKPATLACFEYFSPSVHLQPLLNEYNKNGQKVGNNRGKILKQQSNFLNEVLKFRKEIGSINRTNLGKQKLPEGLVSFCRLCGFNSLTSAVFAYKDAQNLFNQTKNDLSAVVETLQKLHKNIQTRDLSNPSLVGKDFLTAYLYMLMTENHQNGTHNNLAYCYIPQGLEQKNSDEIRRQLYAGMQKNISLIALAHKSGCSMRDCELADALQSTPEYIKAMRMVVEREFSNLKNSMQKQKLVSSLISASENYSNANEAHQAQIKAALAMETLLNQVSLPLHIHGALSGHDLQNFTVSKKVLRDMKYLKTDENIDGLPLNSYVNFDLGIVAELFERDPSCFDKKSKNYIPNSYRSANAEGTAHAQALYELLALRYACSQNVPSSLALASFRPSSDFYLKKVQRAQNKSYAQASFYTV